MAEQAGSVLYVRECELEFPGDSDDFCLKISALTHDLTDLVLSTMLYGPDGYPIEPHKEPLSPEDADPAVTTLHLYVPKPSPDVQTYSYHPYLPGGYVRRNRWYQTVQRQDRRRASMEEAAQRHLRGTVDALAAGARDADRLFVELGDRVNKYQLEQGDVHPKGIGDVAREAAAVIDLGVESTMLCLGLSGGIWPRVEVGGPRPEATAVTLEHTV
jgi:hypothetical protein